MIALPCSLLCLMSPTTHAPYYIFSSLAPSPSSLYISHYHLAAVILLLCMVTPYCTLVPSTAAIKLAYPTLLLCQSAICTNASRFLTLWIIMFFTLLPFHLYRYFTRLKLPHLVWNWNSPVTFFELLAMVMSMVNNLNDSNFQIDTYRVVMFSLCFCRSSACQEIVVLFFGVQAN